jgi:hypothetical protein
MPESVLRFESTLQKLMRGGALPLGQIAWLALAGSAFYGAFMGTYAAFGGQFSVLQIAFSALKVPALLLITGALCLPGFFVLNALLGLADDWAQARRALILTQAVLAIVLASLAPFTLLFYASSNHYPAAILWNFLMFAVASLTAQNVLRRLYAPLIAVEPRHRAMLRLWLAIYGFIAIQFAYTLRPFVGDPSQPVQFFRSGAWDNAYVVLGRMMWKLVFNM